jgi:hypothetical protein
MANRQAQGGQGGQGQGPAAAQALATLVRAAA